MMQENLYEQRLQTPSMKQVQSFKSTPQYIKHTPDEDKLAILVCLIRVWSTDNNQWFKIPKDCLTIRECESIEIHDSYKDLMGKAVLKFPRGTVVHIISKSKENVKVKSPDGSTDTEEPLQTATNSGEVITSSTSQYAEGGSIVSMAMNYDDKGLIEFNRTKDEPQLLSPNDLAIGNRIEIRLGYAYSDTEFRKINSSNGEDMEVAFTGFITAISAKTPLEVECTNMAHVFHAVSVPPHNVKATIPVKQFLDNADGCWNILQDTGIELTESSKGCELQVHGGSISDNLTIADILIAWQNSGVLCMMETQSDGSAKLKIGMAHYVGPSPHGLITDDKNSITYKGGDQTVKIIQFDWDVANDKLTVKNTDKKYLAVEAIGFTEADQQFKVTVRKNPDTDDGGWMVDEEDGTFQTVNKSTITNREEAKVVNGTMTTKKIGKITDKTDMRRYMVVPYISIRKGITQKELIDEAKQYWNKLSPNGISGSIEIFGDIMVRPTDIIGLIDPRYPEKNGYYLVESVETSFGVNGYRRELKIPFKIANFKDNITII